MDCGRSISVIETTIRKQRNYSSTLRGSRTETKELNIHMKTLNEKFLRKCTLTNEIEKEDKRSVADYKKMKPNFESSNFLFESLQPSTKSLMK